MQVRTLVLSAAVGAAFACIGEPVPVRTGTVIESTTSDAAARTAVERAIPNGVEVPLWPDGKVPDAQTNQVRPFLVWDAPQVLKSRSILISVSGGGYGSCGVAGSEVTPIRDAFVSRGVTVVRMRYRVPRPAGLPKHLTAWQDAQRTVRLVRAEAIRRGLDPDSIGFTGCSAGGHLALLAAVSSQTEAYEPVDEADALPCHVNWAIPVYPAYVLEDGADGWNKLKGNDLATPFVPELKFDPATPPMCLFHGDEDNYSSMASVRVYHRLRTLGVPCELHAIARAVHCFMTASARDGNFAEKWLETAWAWFCDMGYFQPSYSGIDVDFALPSDVARPLSEKVSACVGGRLSGKSWHRRLKLTLAVDGSLGSNVAVLSVTNATAAVTGGGAEALRLGVDAFLRRLAWRGDRFEVADGKWTETVRDRPAPLSDDLIRTFARFEFPGADEERAVRFFRSIERTNGSLDLREAEALWLQKHGLQALLARPFWQAWRWKLVSLRCDYELEVARAKSVDAPKAKKCLAEFDELYRKNVRNDDYAVEVLRLLRPRPANR